MDCSLPGSSSTHGIFQSRVLEWVAIAFSICFASWNKWVTCFHYTKWPKGMRLAQVSQFSHSVVYNTLWPHELQHVRLPCPSPSPRTCSNSGPLSWWCHPTILSSVIPFSSRLQSFSASGSFPMSQFFTSGGQSIWVSASASVLPMNIQDWFHLGWTGWNCLQSKRWSPRPRDVYPTTLQIYSWVYALEK